MVKLQNRYVYKDSIHCKFFFLFAWKNDDFIQYIYIIWGRKKFLNQNEVANEKSFRSAALDHHILLRNISNVEKNNFRTLFFLSIHRQN